jgi:type IV pilus assembly protein PilO
MKSINFKKLQLKDIYKWPMVAQVIVGILLMSSLLLLGVFLLISDQYSSLTQAQSREIRLKSEFSDKVKQAVNLQLYRQQLVEITQASDALLKQLPNKTEVEKLLVDINQAGVSRGLKFELFRPNPETLTQYYAELPIDIRVTGTYEAIGEFASDLSQLSRVVILRDMKISKANNENLTMTARAQTFRYLDNEEIERRKAIENANKKTQATRGRK